MKTKQTGEKITINANERGQLPFPKDYLAASGNAVGDEYACWKTPRGVIVVFPKKSKRPRKIPRHAFRGRIGRWNNRKELIIQAKATKGKIKIQELTPEYVLQEYGVTPAQLAASEKRVRREIAADRKAGKLIEFKGKLPKPTKSAWNAIPETLMDGWMFGSYTRYAEPKGCHDGDGFVIAPDGQRAELDWYVGTGKLKRTSRSDKRIWGVFEVGFPRPVTSKADLVENFRAVLPQIKAAFARHQKRRH